MNSLQDTYAPNSICFGCGPKNEKGLKIKSFVAQTETAETVQETSAVEVTAEFFPEPHHEAFPGMVNGGIIGSLLDCHSNWTAAYALMQQASGDEPPCTVTADFHVKLRAPTPSQQKIKLKAKAVELKPDRAKIEAQLFTVADDGKETLTATCVGTFVAVKPGHPAYHRWG
jgi:acyl-coenzyme A thioesterase PaaI-like protein